MPLGVRPTCTAHLKMFSKHPFCQTYAFAFESAMAHNAA